jgi:glycosyltransferase involved in cell wall biosynthesis
MNKPEINKLDITVAIPTFNGENRLPHILDRLLIQSELGDLNWEIIVVDNNSKDKTYEVIQNYRKKSSSNIPIKYFLETQQGAAFARLRAVREARGEIIAFLDDDNIPAIDWLAKAYIFGTEHPKAGAWSGQIHGDFEVKPPANFEKIQAFLAIRQHGDEPHLFSPDKLQLPPGAGFVVRRHVWVENVPQIPQLSGKLPGIFIQGDDYEPLLYIYRAGWQIWYNPAMHSFHQIPHWRLEKNYLLNLARGCGLCTFQLRLINTINWQIPIVFIKTILGNLRRIIHHVIKYNTQLNDDIILRFEIEFYLGSMMSPFYWLKSYFQ